MDCYFSAPFQICNCVSEFQSNPFPHLSTCPHHSSPPPHPPHACSCEPTSPPPLPPPPYSHTSAAPSHQVTFLTSLPPASSLRRPPPSPLLLPLLPPSHSSQHQPLHPAPPSFPNSQRFGPLELPVAARCSQFSCALTRSTLPPTANLFLRPPQQRLRPVRRLSPTSFARKWRGLPRRRQVKTAVLSL